MGFDLTVFDFDFTKILTVLAIIIFGGLGIKFVRVGLRRTMLSQKVDPVLIPFVLSLITIGFSILLIMTVAGSIGIPTASLIAAVSAVSFAVALALQSNLSNLAGGVLLLAFRPFRAGDVVETCGVIGTVQEITLMHTIFLTYDNKKIFIPNGPLSSGNITNYSSQESRGIEWQVGISYASSIADARKAILDVLAADQRILSTPAPVCLVVGLGDNSVDLKVRASSLAVDYWSCFCDNMEAIKLALDKAGVEIPFPQRVVHHINADAVGAAAVTASE